MPPRSTIPMIETDRAGRRVGDASPHLAAAEFNIRTMPEDRRVLHRHPYFELFFINRGEGFHFSDFRRYRVRAGTLAWVAAGQVHTWRATRQLRGFRAAFAPADVGTERGTLLAELPVYFSVNPRPPTAVPRGQWAEFNGLFEALIGELQQARAMQGEAARSLLKLILIQGQRLAGLPDADTRGSAAAALARRFLLEVEGSYRRVHRVNDYARALGVTPNHLVETVRQRLGVTPGEIVDRRLFLEAQRLLAHTTRSSAEIGFDLGFPSASNFGRSFKRRAGCSPTEFRARFHKSGQSFAE